MKTTSQIKFSAVLALLLGSTASYSQDTTPLRTLGESSPGFLNPPVTDSNVLRTQQAERETKAQTRTVTTHSVDGSLIPWWEGMEDIAINSMKTKDYSINFGLTAGWEFDDNLYQTPTGDKTGVNAYYVRPEGSFTYVGAKWKVNARYVPEFRTSDTDEIDDVFNQVGSASVEYNGAKSNVSLSFRIADTDGANVEVGERVSSVTTSTTLAAAYDLSEKTSVGGSAAWESYDYDELNSYYRFTAKSYFDYKITPKTRLGLGVGYEYVNMETGADANAVNAAIRVAWQATQKLGFRGSAGAEYRSYDGGNDGAEPIFSLGVLYSPREGTTASLDFYRRNSPSIGSTNQSFYSTGVAAVFSQKVFSRLNVSLIGGFETSEYEVTVDEPGNVAGPDADYWFVRPQFTVTLFEKLAMNIFYQYSESTGSNTTTRNYAGASLTYSF